MALAPKMHRVSGSGVALNLAEWEGGGPGIFCVHGLTANCRCWDGMAESLSPAHRVLAVDLRGRGLSDAPDTGYSLEQHCHDLQQVMHTWDMKPVVLMGHSLGAAIALAFAASFPERVRAVVLVDGGGKLEDDDMEAVLQGIAPSLKRLGRIFASPEEYLETIKRSRHFQPWNDVCEAAFRHELTQGEQGVRCCIHPEHIREEVENHRMVDISGYYSRIACPVLVLRASQGLLGGEQGLLLPRSALDRMLRGIPKTECVDVKGTDHYSILFQPNSQRDRAVLDFVDRV